MSAHTSFLKWFSLLLLLFLLKPDEVIASAIPTTQPRRACSVYLWDFPSALLRRWGEHLIKDQIYEGKGGKYFVRIPPGSVLQWLHPVSRFHPDRCLICGGNFRDHLELWWSRRHLYKPFDLYLDQLVKTGVERTVTPARPMKGKYNTNRIIPAVVHKKFVFHRSYINEIERDELRKLQLQAGKVGKSQTKKKKNKKKLPEVRKTGSSIYTVPFPTRFDFGYLWFRERLLMRVNFLFSLEELDKAKHEATQQQNPLTMSQVKHSEILFPE